MVAGVGWKLSTFLLFPSLHRKCWGSEKGYGVRVGWHGTAVGIWGTEGL